ncbi:sterol desaturase family protein [Pseudomaricurvus alkylphenolicus]|uniref:sterol desaturase family protein n=1 Tax=Pseudomaricurvus alkylphenolicus TaxID=1306991 RepID=UPI001423628F|nr:sterol desaturase family protein [Pseudomaricurvus alkylphenolicus]NIB40149.1 sterol desaturase family protein [Pseudomaricurvus alkylphenolicus]
MKDLILMAAIPGFLLLMALELWWDRRRGLGLYRLNDAFGSLTLGMMSRTTKLMLLSLGALFMDRVLPEARLMQWPAGSVWTWVFTFVAYDFLYYWYHRMGHTINILWAGHSIHHQSEDYNLSTALRQTSTGIWDWVFYAPLLVLGVPVDVFLACAALNLIYQFWVHTQVVDKLGWMEWVMVTPSNHRVHHGQNPEYIDKNHGGVFIVWDRMFGSFQPELEGVEIIYGVSRPLRSLNPVRANLQVWASLAADAWHTRSWWDKLRIWFMPTGWRPADVVDAYPIASSDLQAFEKFDPPCDVKTRFYTLFQLAAGVPLLVYFMLHFDGLSYGMLLLGFAMVTLPLVTTSWMLEGRGRFWEWRRLLGCWVGFVLAWPTLASSSVAVFGIYLSFNSVLYLWLWGWQGASSQLSSST